jgi:hypothetical protein
LARRPKPKAQSDPSQYDRFIETARQLGCDEDEAAFDEKLKKIARPKPKPDR